ncbi:MAG: glycosyltransferase family 4 protein [Nitrospinae bacterium]|nr:glycosyltransferase family 4 protein [Nitrospinota bacterium]
MIFERDENGFFEKVVTLHPFSNKTYFLKLNDCHEVHEIGFDLFPGGGKNRLLIYLQLPIHFFRIVLKTVQLTRKFKFDLIRANDPYWMGLFGYICSRICEIPFCVSIHADYDKRMDLDKKISTSSVLGSYKIAKQLERFILSKANMIMPIRQSLAIKAVALGAKEDKVRVIPHGIDLTYFNRPPINNIRQLFNIDSAKKIISFVGRLSKDNYVDDILEIGRKLGRKRQDFLIIMAGGDKEENRIKEEVASNIQLQRHILLTGFQAREICLDLRRASHVSLCLMAGFSLIEACAAGRPVVSYDVEWHSELVKNNETGFLIAEHDVNGVVKALDWLLDHPNESDKMGQNAKSLAFEAHDLTNTTAIKTKCYSEMLLQEVDN